MDDINSNRQRAHSVFTRLDDAQGKNDILAILKPLVQEESPEQSVQLFKLEDVDLPETALLIKHKKYGRGLTFFPQKLKELTKHSQIWLDELIEI